MKMCHTERMYRHSRQSNHKRNEHSILAQLVIFEQNVQIKRKQNDKMIKEIEQVKKRLVTHFTTHRCVCAYRILLCLPIVPCRSHKHLFVEAQIFHFHRSD